MNAAAPEPLRLAVLGGSGSGIPVFMAALRASQEQGRLGAIDVRLYGRNSAKLESVSSYIERSLLCSRSWKGEALCAGIGRRFRIGDVPLRPMRGLRRLA